MLKNNILKIFLVVFALFILASCYQMDEPTSGDLALKASLPARAPGDTGEMWVVGLVIDAAFEDDLKELFRIYDIQDSDDVYDDYRDSDADKILEDMLQKGAVRFDGGRFFFQFKMSVPEGEGPFYTGDFLVSGIPADKKYFLYIMVFDNQITSIDDMDDDEETDADLFMSMSYYDPAVHGSSPGYDGDYQGIQIPAGTPAGWYYFYDWDTSYNGSTLTLDSANIWAKNGVPVSNQSFLVEPGKETSLEILLIEDEDEPEV